MHLKTFQIHNTFSDTLESFSPNAKQNVFLSKLPSSSPTSHSATMVTSALPAHRCMPPSRLLWLAVQKPVPPTNDNNAWSKVQAITNVSSNHKCLKQWMRRVYFPFLLVWWISPIFLAQEIFWHGWLDNFFSFCLLW